MKECRRLDWLPAKCNVVCRWDDASDASQCLTELILSHCFDSVDHYLWKVCFVVPQVMIAVLNLKCALDYSQQIIFLINIRIKWLFDSDFSPITEHRTWVKKCPVYEYRNTHTWCNNRVRFYIFFNPVMNIPTHVVCDRALLSQNDFRKWTTSIVLWTVDWRSRQSKWSVR